MGGRVHANHFNQAVMCDTCSRIISLAQLTPQQILKDGRKPAFLVLPMGFMK